MRRLFDINRALISKLGWMIYKRPDALWVKALRAKYLRDCQLLEAPSPPDCSWI